MDQPEHSSEQRLRVLLLEDSELDAELVLAELEDGGFACEALRVEAEDPFAKALLSCPDLILADYSLPAFDGISALKLAREICPAVPFLFVSGALGEELAIETLKQGATDYILKHRLERLVPAVRRALREAEGQRERARLEAELRARAEELAESDRRKDEFLAVLAHELRNPLAPIFNALYAMRSAPDDSHICGRSRDIVDRQVRHMSRLLDDLLDLSRISRGKILLRPQPLDWKALVQETVEDHRLALEGAGLQVELDLPAAPVPVYGDRTRLAQVTGNLLNNSRKFTPRGGRVTIALRPAADSATLHVRDTGIGIELDALDSIFAPFSQEARSRQSDHGGLGLGLALVKGLLEMHQGCVSVRSAGPGLGAEFICWLPLSESVPVEVATPRDTAASAPEGLRVLVIDDNRDAADTLAELLTLSGSQVEVAYNGLGGLQVAEQFHPHVILCDLGLPDIDGFTVAERVREGEEPHPRLIAVSGYGQAQDRQRSQRSGFDLHLTKPVDPEMLQRILAEAW